MWIQQRDRGELLFRRFCFYDVCMTQRVMATLIRPAFQEDLFTKLILGLGICHNMYVNSYLLSFILKVVVSLTCSGLKVKCVIPVHHISSQEQLQHFLKKTWTVLICSVVASCQGTAVRLLRCSEMFQASCSGLVKLLAQHPGAFVFSSRAAKMPDELSWIVKWNPLLGVICLFILILLLTVNFSLIMFDLLLCY